MYLWVERTQHLKVAAYERGEARDGLAYGFGGCGIQTSFGKLMREDDSRTRTGHAAEKLATLRRMAMNLLTRDKTKKRAMKGKQFNASMDHQYLLHLLDF